MNTAGKLPKLLQGTREVVSDPRNLRAQLGHPRRYRGLCRAKVQHQRHQPLLDAIVQIAFDPAAGQVTGRHDPRTRRGKFPAALLQRLGHRVEAALQDADFGDATLWYPHTEIATGKAAGHGSDCTDWLDDCSCQIAGKQHDQQDRPCKTGCRSHDRATRNDVRALLAFRR